MREIEALCQALFEHAACGAMRMDEGQGFRLRHDPAMAVTTPVAEHDDVSRLRLLNFMTVIEDEAEIAFLTAM